MLAEQRPAAEQSAAADQRPDALPPGEPHRPGQPGPDGGCARGAIQRLLRPAAGGVDSGLRCHRRPGSRHAGSPLLPRLLRPLLLPAAVRLLRFASAGGLLAPQQQRRQSAHRPDSEAAGPPPAAGLAAGAHHPARGGGLLPLEADALGQGQRRVLRAGAGPQRSPRRARRPPRRIHGGRPDPIRGHPREGAEFPRGPLRRRHLGPRAARDRQGRVPARRDPRAPTRASW